MSIGKMVNGLLALSMLSGCATANLSPGETLNAIDIAGYPGVPERTYKTTDDSDILLRTAMGIKKGTILVDKDYRGNIRMSGMLPNMLSDLRTFDELYVKADTNGDGAVDTPEADVLYRQAVEGALK